MERWDKIKQIPGKSLENIINILKLKKFEGIIDGLKRLKTKYFRVGPKYSKEIDNNLYSDQSGVGNVEELHPFNSKIEVSADDYKNTIYNLMKKDLPFPGAEISTNKRRVNEFFIDFESLRISKGENNFYTFGSLLTKYMLNSDTAIDFHALFSELNGMAKQYNWVDKGTGKTYTEIWNEKNLELKRKK